MHRLRDHATWRPDWAVGRPRLLWYLTLEDQPALAEWVTLAHERLRGVPVLDLVPPAWLHLTLDDVGFPDELTDGQVTDVVRCARQSLAGWSAAPLVLGPVTTMEDSLVRRVQPAALLRDLRARLRTARVEAVGALPDDQPDFDPHVTVAYVNADCDERLVTASVAAFGTDEHTVQVATVTLACVTRHARRYEWTARELLARTVLSAPTSSADLHKIVGAVRRSEGGARSLRPGRDPDPVPDPHLRP